MLPPEAKSSQFATKKSCRWTSAANRGLRGTMEDANARDTNVTDLVVQLCTRIGMMMEDASPLALDALREGLEHRVTLLEYAIHDMGTVVQAAKVLLER